MTDPRLEELLQRYFRNKEIAKERNEENKEILEQLEQLFEEAGEEEVVVLLGDGTEAVIKRQASVKETLDRDALAQELLVAKDEIKTPFDYSMFTSQGKLSPAMISEHTSVDTVIRLKMIKRKPRRRGRRQRSNR